MKITNNGRTKPAFLTLSDDRFTVHITTSKLKKNSKVGIMEVPRPFLKKVTSIGSNDDDSDFQSSIDVGSIDRLQKGQTTLRFELARKMSSRVSSPRKSLSTDFLDLDPERCFSIIYSGERTLDCMISDVDVSRDDVLNALHVLFETYTRAKVHAGNDVVLLRHIWIDVDKDRSDSINANELAGILRRINLYKKRADTDKLYHSFAKMMGLDRNGRRKGISFENTVTILHKIKRDSWEFKPVHNIWFHLFGRLMNNGKDRVKVSAESFLKKFIWQKQGESNVTMEEVGDIFRFLNQLEVAHVATNLHLSPDDINASRFIDRDRFEAYLISLENEIFDPRAEQFDASCMNRSLSEYWINSSHNTYLTGDQFQSRSSVEMYMNALHRGCRCLELDCFDGYRDSDNTPVPMVYHGLTITSKIMFFDIIDAIKLFLNSNQDCYPIILSLENHCSLPFQESMASYMISVFGESLYIPNEASLHEPLPSPEELKGKILLKGRRITDKKEDYYQGSAFDTDSDDDDSVIEGKETVGDRDDMPLSPKSNVSRQASVSFSPELSRITIFHGVHMNSFEESKQKGKDCMLSINESKARKLNRSKEYRAEWIDYNKTHLSRVYPSGKRVDSSNFNPIAPWSKGVQMCALNIQTPDAARRLNDGRFRQNGNCGYVLKPLTLIGDQSPKPLKLSIKILGGTCLPKAKGDKKGEYIDPYVQVSIFDISSVDGREVTIDKYTHPVHKNGFNPIWQHDPFKFRIEHPEISMLQFTVWDRDVTSSDTFIGSASIPVSCVREGFRSVHLFDANNKRNGAFGCASLLVEVEMKMITEEIKMW